MPSEVDVVVIGGGMVGGAVAYYLSHAGYQVALLERGELACGASGANMGSVAVHTMDRGLLLQMAVGSSRIYSSLGLELECNLEYERRGAMVVVEDEEEWRCVQRLAAAQREAGLSVELLRGEDARRLEPALGPAVLGATYCASHVQVNPHRLTVGFASAARRLGAEILTQTPAVAVEVQGDRVVGVRTPNGTVRCSWVVNAAGVGALAVGRMIGVEHRIAPSRGHVLLTEPRPDLVRSKVSSVGGIHAKHSAQSPQARALTLGLSVTPTLAGNLMLGTSNEVAVAEDVSARLEATRAIAENTCRIVPGLRGARIVRTWAGSRPVTPDGMPLVGACDGPEGYLVAAGHAGHGLGLAPVTGRYLAKVVASGGKGPTLSEFVAGLQGEDGAALPGGDRCDWCTR